MSFQKDEIQYTLMTIIKDILNKDVNLDDNFVDLGGQSLEMQDILGAVYHKYKVKIKMKDVLSLEYIDNIIEHIWTKINNNIIN